MKKPKKIIILQHGGGELANQLWNFASIYAYCKERGYECRNYSFFEYGRYFNIPVKNKIIELLFFLPFQNHQGRRHSPRTRFFRFIYKIYVKTVSFFCKKRVVSSISLEGKKYFLPPTERTAQIEHLEKTDGAMYFTGWLFRNPEGLLKYKKEIANYFKPKEKYAIPAEKKIAEAKKTHRNVIGVHIRQSDYRTHKSGEYFIPQERVRIILDEYLKNSGKRPEETLFIITSDEPIEEKLFEGLNIQVNRGTVIEDFYLLSLCAAIIGSNSSFGNLAAYLGDKPHIVFQKGDLDWDYYRGKTAFFQNKYCTVV